MGVQVAGTRLQWLQLSTANSSTPSQAIIASVVSTLESRKRKAAAAASRGCNRVLSSPFLGAGSARLLRARSLMICGGRGRRSFEQALRRAFSASLERFGTGDDNEEEEFVQRLEELVLELQQQQGNGREDPESWRSEEGDALASSSSFYSAASPVPSPLPLSKKQEPTTEPPWLPVRPNPPVWPDQIVPASVEKNANSVELPLSLRIIKRKKRWQDGWLREAGESAYCSVKRAFSSMVFMIRELQSYTLQMREVLFHEDLQGILERVQREMNSSFVWLFQQIFSCTPTLMVSVMLLLANFTFYSIDHVHASAMAAPNPPTQLIETVAVEDHRQNHHDFSYIETISSTGRIASIGGNGAGGGKTRPVAGATGDGRSDDGYVAYQTVLPDGVSTAPGAVNTEEGGGAARAEEREEDEARVWKAIVEEASRMQLSTMNDAVMVSPVTVELEPDDYADYLRTEIMYQQAVSQDPENALVLANFAQFLYLVLRDHDRAEYYFKRATGLKPPDAEALGRYASFLWVAKKDVAAAEETYLEAIAADPSNTAYAAGYAHFLWSTGGEETCFPQDGGKHAW
ncbi:hypothetical protein Cni_G13435 [Canna indica]|uniref:Tetratricopeptide repeat-like superfamily protein n=1 Tax=Canna indica TaxID=4628 RepID=A0AAQ3K9I4_9LILI|nr:hypothetical protein Cni_G13435 [Canna indica]